MRKEYLFAIFSVFAWGTMAPISKLLLDGYSNMEVLGYGSAVGALLLFAVLVVKGELKQIKEYKISGLLRLVVLGFMGYFLYSVFYYQGLKLLTSQTACVLNYLWPIVSVVMSCLLLKEGINRMVVIAIILSFVGVVVMMFPQMQEGNAIRGYAFCVIGAALYGCFNVLNKKQGGNQTVNMFVYLSVGAVCALVMNIPNGFHIPDGMGIMGFLWLGIVIDGLGYLLWAMAMQGSATSLISNLAYATPVISLILSAVFLKEMLSKNMIAGGILIFAGIIIQIFRNITNTKKSLASNAKQ